MELSISGKVIDVLQEMSGEGRNGPWRKRDFIIETQDNYPKTICMTQWGDQIDASQVQKGEMIKAHIDIQSREYNGRWYTDVKAWRVEKDGANAGQGQPGTGDSGNFPPEAPGSAGRTDTADGSSTPGPGAQQKPGGFDIPDDVDDDLPF